jgi:DNA-binding NarL/FixJ family response regulator
MAEWVLHKESIMIKLVVADHHPVVRSGVTRVLTTKCSVEVCAETGSEQETIEAVHRTPCDILLLDTCLPGRGVVETIRRVKSTKPQVKVLVFSIYPPEQYALRAFKTGASGYVTKDADLEDLCEAIRVVASGKRYISREIIDMMTENLGDSSAAPRHECLSDREFEVFFRLSRGVCVTEIGRDMCLSHKTISTYRKRIMDKMGMTSNAELTRYSYRNHLIT